MVHLFGFTCPAMLLLLTTSLTAAQHGTQQRQITRTGCQYGCPTSAGTNAGAYQNPAGTGAAGPSGTFNVQGMRNRPPPSNTFSSGSSGDVLSDSGNTGNAGSNGYQTSGSGQLQQSVFGQGIRNNPPPSAFGSSNGETDGGGFQTSEGGGSGQFGQGVRNNPPNGGQTSGQHGGTNVNFGSSNGNGNRGEFQTSGAGHEGSFGHQQTGNAFGQGMRNNPPNGLPTQIESNSELPQTSHGGEEGHSGGVGTDHVEGNGGVSEGADGFNRDDFNAMQNLWTSLGESVATIGFLVSGGEGSRVLSRLVSVVLPVLTAAQLFLRA
ncbi:hypothetical protein BV898_02885 [Hypsibius exemplaris]|uniref:Uncharacterized protein n=1 Tax=Hypsibius exemplaris TaxID=2072580 RepID=A0A1W0X7C7_HYPEX|nr:hypothetical protein BV898_02885 [Hypsibius exemplaris]